MGLDAGLWRVTVAAWLFPRGGHGVVSGGLLPVVGARTPPGRGPAADAGVAGAALGAQGSGAAGSPRPSPSPGARGHLVRG